MVAVMAALLVSIDAKIICGISSSSSSSSSSSQQQELPYPSLSSSSMHQEMYGDIIVWV
jgi:hypothetical protein